MYRILYVEDESSTRTFFLDELRDEMPDVEVLEASSVRVAKQIIAQEAAENRGFDAVILDTHLPGEDNTMKMDLSLCSIVRRRFCEALVVHCSKFEADEFLSKHIREEHIQSPFPRGCFVPKSDNWSAKLIRALATDRVGTRLSDFFSGLGTPAGRPGRGNTSAELAQLAADIARFWSHLPQTLQDRINDDFERTGDDKVRLRVRQI